MNIRSIIIGLFCMIAAQVSAWFQLNSQFIWPWAKTHPWLFIILPSVPISIFYYYATKYFVEGFGGIMWPGRFLSFGVGVVIFAILVYVLKNEGMNAKTVISLVLASSLMAVQVFWK